jgi:predicted metal-dependent phosphoesterase TrpH
MRLKIDLHVHSAYSVDSVTTIEQIIQQVQKQGLQGYALTDHDTMDGVKEAAEKSENSIFIPGIEVSTRNGHVILLDLTEPIAPHQSIGETVDQAHSQGATAIIAHPYGLPRSWVNVDKIKQVGLDAVEVANSAQIPYNYITNLNRKLALKLGLPQTGGSDSHIPETIGRAYTLIESKSTEVQDIIKAIKNGKTTPFGTGITVKERFIKILRKIGV